ncbi:zinc-binding dehydrogenase [Streptomyces aureus]|uniref:zinc-binding dehydrogenase n=1 Tax=Streptomyces aureus TaxID=193461 RepID=UPI003F53F5A5
MRNTREPIATTGGTGTMAAVVQEQLGAGRMLGADQVIDYTRDDFLVGSRRYDVVIDIAATAACGICAAPSPSGGRLVITGGETNGPWLGGTDRQLRAQMLSRAWDRTARPACWSVGEYPNAHRQDRLVRDPDPGAPAIPAAGSVRELTPRSRCSPMDDRHLLP